MVKIFLDAGHGGNDPGAIGNGIKEKDVALKTVLKLGEALKKIGAVVTYSRTNDKTLTLYERTKKANTEEAQLFISIHNNAAVNTSAKGYEDFIFNGKNTSAEIQKTIHQETKKVVEKYKMQNRGMKKANYHVLRETVGKAILIELAFITNKSDAELLKDENFINEMVQAMTTGVANFYGLKKPVEKETTKTYEVVKGDTLTKIAKEFKTTVAKLKAINNLKDANAIKAGQKLKIK